MLRRTTCTRATAWLLMLLCLLPMVVMAGAAVPALDDPVVDAANALSADTRDILRTQAFKLQARTGAQLQVLVVDDSRVARQQIRSVLDQLGVGATLLSDGKQALDHLLQVHASGENPAERYAMVISDIEMPAMDGYTLTTEIRRHPGLAGLYVLLHTSLSGVFNNAMVERVGANAFVAKYSPHELADFVLDRLRKVALAA